MGALPKIVNAVIFKIVPGSIAEELELEPGDKLLKINDEVVLDQIAYRYLQADEYLELEIQKENGEQWIIEVQKESHEDLGLIFAEATFDGIKECRNKCIFCFVDQMPKNLRHTLYIKDDDYRYSFLYGNFITLTNLSGDELKRIIQWKLSPLYVSIHTTNPELRKKMLGNRYAGKLMEQLRYLTAHGIAIHGQIVLVPGVNDGKELEKTIEDLSGLIPGILSLAVVPVGLTSSRAQLEQLEPFSRLAAQEILRLVNNYQHYFLENINTRYIFAADEFFILAGEKIPDSDYYEDYPQLENGVGVVRLFIDDFAKLINYLPENIVTQKPRVIITGISAYKILDDLIKKLKDFYLHLNVQLIGLPNTFFGPAVTVAGLLTGQDLIEGLSRTEIPADSKIIIPDIMLKEQKLFLDDLTLEDVEIQTGYKLSPVPSNAQSLIEEIIEAKLTVKEV